MNKLPKVVKKGKKRVGRGYGSGKGGHTAGRGMKGQKSRSKVNILFEGIKVRKSLLKTLPIKRGKDKFKGAEKAVPVKLEALNILRAGSKVTLESLVKEGIVSKKDADTRGVKILDGGKLTKKLTVNLPASATARKKIEKAGGKVE